MAAASYICCSKRAEVSCSSNHWTDQTLTHSGHYPDQGSLELIANGTVKVKQCDNGIQRLTSSGVVLADGREIEADAIVLATGYKHADHALRRIFGDELADQCTIGMRFDDHNEINGVSGKICF
jgi:lysine/ornithine N-monooxygenase